MTSLVFSIMSMRKLENKVSSFTGGGNYDSVKSIMPRQLSCRSWIFLLDLSSILWSLTNEQGDSGPTLEGIKATL